MDNIELKNALLSKEPVIYTNNEGVDTEYRCVSHILYGERNGRITISAEIMDMNNKSVTICDPKRLRLKGSV